MGEKHATLGLVIICLKAAGYDGKYEFPGLGNMRKGSSINDVHPQEGRLLWSGNTVTSMW